MPDQPVLIAGPTASGKSALALEIATRQGGVILNADASQIYDCWQIVTARPDAGDLARAPHGLYGHVGWDQPYSVGHWLRELHPYLQGDQRPIIVGGTGLYFSALTRGMAEIPQTPTEIRQEADTIPLEQMIAELDARTLGQLDQQNRARVQRAYEVLRATGQGLADWQANTPPPLLPAETCAALVFDISSQREKNWLKTRIEQRFDQMLEHGALDEIARMEPLFDPNRPAFRAIGVPELIAYQRGALTLDQAREKATISTRQFAKRQRSWFRSKMWDWHKVTVEA